MIQLCAAADTDPAQGRGASNLSLYAQLAAVTEEAYKAGSACLEGKDAKGAEAFLSLALSACPADRPKAQDKIRALLATCKSARA